MQLGVRKESLPAAGALLAAAVAGGAVAVAGASMVGVGSNTTTVREVLAGFASSPSNVTDTRTSKGLTLREIYKRDAPGVVQVTSTMKVQLPQTDFYGNPFNLPGTEVQRSLGSGFVIDKAGYIVTNYHVVGSAQSVQVSFSNNDSMKARIVGKDPSTDIALLKVAASNRALKPLQLGNSDSVHVGDSVAAIGNPFGYDRSISAGIISALQRSLNAPNGSPIDRVIQTDAPLNHGNSGGPMLNAQGQVIGVSSAVVNFNWGGGGNQGNSGVGFAIPINTVTDVVAQLKAHGRADHPLLGALGRPVNSQIAKLFQLPATHGVLVERVIPGSGAAAAGLRAGSTPVVVAGESYDLGGDLIVKVGGMDVATTERLRELVAERQPGDTIQVEYFRGNERRKVDVKLGRQPSPPQR